MPKTRATETTAANKVVEGLFHEVCGLGPVYRLLVGLRFGGMTGDDRRNVEVREVNAGAKSSHELRELLVALCVRN